MSAIPILFEDGEALVIDKLAGLPIERPRAGGRCLEDHLEELKLGFQRPPVAVHRIDTDTSGCLLMARNPKALKRFNQAFEARQVEKVYLGVVAGDVPQDEGTIALSLSKVSSAGRGWRMIPAKKGKDAVTHWRKLAVQGGLTLIEFRPETGRTHQIRVHAQVGLGCALYGDPVYGKGQAEAAHTLLHAWQLVVQREGKAPVSAVAPLPEAFRKLGFDDDDLSP